MVTDQKSKALGLAISQIEKNWGKGSIMKMGEASKMKVEAVSTGCLSLDLALGVGGLPRGRIVEIFGPEAGGKTTVTLLAIAEVQRNGGVAAFIDAEHSMDPVYAGKLGVNIDDLLISQPDYGEQALEITETLVRSGAIDIIVIDSVAALVPKAEIEGEMGEARIGLQARLMSQALRKLTAVVNKSKSIVVFVNQLREKVGIMFGNPEITPGGRALKFYSSVRLEVRPIEKIREGTLIIGARVNVKVVKNKVAPPFKSAEFLLKYGEGISKYVDLVEVAANLNFIEKMGAWYSYEGKKIGQGLENAQKHLEENPSLFSEILDKVKKHIKEQKPKHANDNIGGGEEEGEEEKNKKEESKKTNRKEN